MHHNLLTRSSAFRRLTKHAFELCDVDGTGYIGKAELYAGILLVHIQLAQYAGIAACHPPSRKVVEELFDASDHNHSGFIDEQEFTRIIVICCAQIASRVVVYLGLIVLLVPYAAEHIVLSLIAFDGWMHWNVQAEAERIGLFNWVEHFLTWGKLAEKVVSASLLFSVVPFVFSIIDRHSREAAERKYVDKIAALQPTPTIDAVKKTE